MTEIARAESGAPSTRSRTLFGVNNKNIEFNGRLRDSLPRYCCGTARGRPAATTDTSHPTDLRGRRH